MQITKDSGASFIITTKERAEAFENAIDMEALLSCGDDRKPEIKTEEDALAYLIETIPNPQQSWGESCTQVAMNEVP